MNGPSTIAVADPAGGHGCFVIGRKSDFGRCVVDEVHAQR